MACSGTPAGWRTEKSPSVYQSWPCCDASWPWVRGPAPLLLANFSRTALSAWGRPPGLEQVQTPKLGIRRSHCRWQVKSSVGAAVVGSPLITATWTAHSGGSPGLSGMCTQWQENFCGAGSKQSIVVFVLWRGVSIIYKYLCHTYNRPMSESSHTR